MKLGAFSISLGVKDLEASKQFYEKLDSFADIRDIEKHLKEQGVELMSEAEESSSGPASFMLLDTDGNAVLVDQHV